MTCPVGHDKANKACMSNGPDRLKLAEVTVQVPVTTPPGDAHDAPLLPELPPLLIAPPLLPEDPPVVELPPVSNGVPVLLELHAPEIIANAIAIARTDRTFTERLLEEGEATCRQ